MASFWNQRCAATKIQSQWRRCHSEHNYKSTLHKIIAIQSVTRSWLVRLECGRRLEAATIIQRWSRQCKEDALARQFAASKAVEEREVEATLILQRTVRGFFARKFNREHRAATMIQKTWRCYAVHVDFMLAILDAITIQRAIRRFLHARRVEAAIPAIIKAQACGRGMLARKQHAFVLSCVIRIQSIARGFLAREYLAIQDCAATMIQSLCRGHLARADIDMWHFAASDLQRTWRGFVQRKWFLRAKRSVTTIQSFARMIEAPRLVLQRKQERAHEIAEWMFYSRLAYRIQCAYRGYKIRIRMGESAVTIQRYARSMLAAKLKLKRLRLVVQMQSLYRGWGSRKLRSKSATKIAQRLRKATERAHQNPSLRLGARTKRALMELQTSKRLSEIMNAAKILETSTRLSRKCCLAFSEAGAPSILYNLVGTCNRSLPHIEILRYVLLTLNNVALHPDLVPSVATDNSANVFMDLLQMFRDKDDLFHLSVNLLCAVVQMNLKLRVSSSSALWTIHRMTLTVV